VFHAFTHTLGDDVDDGAAGDADNDELSASTFAFAAAMPGGNLMPGGNDGAIGAGVGGGGEGAGGRGGRQPGRVQVVSFVTLFQ